jgi:heptosyltransferase-3
VDKTRLNGPGFGILSDVRRLVIRPGAIGDFIVSLPALERLRSPYLEVWVSSPNVPLVRFADRVRSIASTGLDLLGVAEPPAHLLDELRGFDSIVSWYGANRPEFRDLMLGLNLPCIFFPALPPAMEPSALPAALPPAMEPSALPPAPPPEATAIHATDFYLDQVRELSTVPGGDTPQIPCQAARANFAAIHPFSGNPRKNWPLEKFRRVARGLERSMPVRWCAGPEDPPLDGAVLIHDLYELACWLASARLYIGNDSGITHLAAAVGTPVLALFGPTDPGVWAPRGPNVRVARWGP